MTNATTMIDMIKIPTVAHNNARDDTSGSPPSASREASNAVSDVDEHARREVDEEQELHRPGVDTGEAEHQGRDQQHREQHAASEAVHLTAGDHAVTEPREHQRASERRARDPRARAPSPVASATRTKRRTSRRSPAPSGFLASQTGHGHIGTVGASGVDGAPGADPARRRHDGLRHRVATGRRPPGSARVRVRGPARGRRRARERPVRSTCRTTPRLRRARRRTSHAALLAPSWVACRPCRERTPGPPPDRGSAARRPPPAATRPSGRRSRATRALAPRARAPPLPSCGARSGSASSSATASAT